MASIVVSFARKVSTEVCDSHNLNSSLQHLRETSTLNLNIDRAVVLILPVFFLYELLRLRRKDGHF